MHLAAAVQLPVVEISSFPENGNPNHDNSPVRFAPRSVGSVILQPKRSKPGCNRACTKRKAHCILEIDVHQVKLAVESIIGSTGIKRGNLDDRILKASRLTGKRGLLPMAPRTLFVYGKRRAIGYKHLQKQNTPAKDLSGHTIFRGSMSLCCCFVSLL